MGVLLPFARIDVGNEGSANGADGCRVGDEGGLAFRRRRHGIHQGDDARNRSREQSNGRKQDQVAVFFRDPHTKKTRRDESRSRAARRSLSAVSDAIASELQQTYPVRVAWGDEDVAPGISGFRVSRLREHDRRNANL